MRINLNGTYKSLTSFQSQELADFIIITGKNGVGKTQLIEGIKAKNEHQHRPMPDLPNYNVEVIPTALRPQFEGITIAETFQINRTSWHNMIKPIIDKFLQWNPKIKEFCQRVVEDSARCGNLYDRTLSVEAIIRENSSPLAFASDLCVLWNLGSAVQYGFNLTEEQKLEQDIHRLNAHMLGERYSIVLAADVRKYSGKNFVDLKEDEYYSAPIPESALQLGHIFQIQVESLFFSYAKKRRANEIEYLRKKEYDEQNSAVSDIEFVQSFPPPWETINKILASNSINYQVKGIDRKEYSEELVFNFYLIKNSSGHRVEFKDLSSGEKVIIGLIIKLFLAESYTSTLQLPDYLFLDEPDAHLHPEMSQLLINVLYNSFVKQFGMRVVMTTHDPSSVALAPDDCLYELKNEPGTSLTKISKDDALRILTQNLPLLSIDYKNHRQVFVESPNDVAYYQTIFEHYFRKHKLAFRLYFISTSAHKAGCGEVRRFVKSIRDSGINKAFGIVDWDGENTAKDFPAVYVHGEAKRYSIENFLLDPLYLAVLFLNQGNGNNIEKELDFLPAYDEYGIKDEDEGRLQQIANWIIDKVQPSSPLFRMGGPVVEIHYWNGKKISVPQWYLIHNGHDLATFVKKVFPSIQHLKESDLLAKLIPIAGKCFPLVPVDSIELMNALGE